MKDPEILNKASQYVFTLFKDKLSKKLVYHTYKHTTETVNEVRKLCALQQLPDTDTELVLLAAWLHDIGYVNTYEGHEENSARLAEAFLKEEGYPEDRISKVVQIIRNARISVKSE